MNLNQLKNLRFKDLETLLEEFALFEGNPKGIATDTNDAESSDTMRVRRAQVRKKIEDAIKSSSRFGKRAAPSAGGGLLFIGKGRHRRLSDEGRVVRAHAEEILSSLRRLAEQATLDDGRWGGVRIAYRAVLWDALVHGWTRDWSRLAPSVPMEIRGDRAQMLDDHLEFLDPDIALQFDPPAPGPYASTVLWCEKLVLVANNTGRSGSHRVLREQDIGDRFIHVDRGKRYNTNLKRSLARNLRTGLPRFQFTVQSHAIDCLCETSGAAGYFSEHLLSERARRAKADGVSLDLTALKAPTISRPVYLVYRARFGDPHTFAPSELDIPGQLRPLDREAFEALIGRRRDDLPAELTTDELNTCLVRAMLRDLLKRAADVSVAVDDPL